MVRFNLYDLSQFNQVCLPIGMLKVNITKLSFIKFPKVQHSPLTVEEAKCRLRDLIPKVYSALHQLHSALKIAHLDVRLENLCYDAEMNVVLIDLDRWEPLRLSGKSFCSTYHVMYEKPEILNFDIWETKHSDFKQFGKYSRRQIKVFKQMLQLSSYFIVMAPAIDFMDECALSNKVRTLSVSANTRKIKVPLY